MATRAACLLLLVACAVASSASEGTPAGDKAVCTDPDDASCAAQPTAAAGAPDTESAPQAKKKKTKKKAAEGTDTPPKKEETEEEKKQNAIAKKRRGKHTFLSDFVSEHVLKTCRAVAREFPKKKGLKAKKRCEFLVDQVDEVISRTVQQIQHTIEHTMQDIVDNAAHDANFHDMVRRFAKLSHWLLELKKSPKESEIAAEVNKSLQMWAVEVATLQKQKGQQRLAPEAIKRLQEKGINLGSEFEEFFDYDMYDSKSWGVHK
eukprot:TRINITY_DN11265_c0_g1_i1.p1 TRINITY_DN11265_c0_g1~~TRINITY_DN11265_c0_g1_i1.p1  ORF type:complete len:280 (+),score=114.27 TRINITY_DN11265_c0_g1_i1:55-840(+)